MCHFDIHLFDDKLAALSQSFLNWRPKTLTNNLKQVGEKNDLLGGVTPVRPEAEERPGEKTTEAEGRQAQAQEVGLCPHGLKVSPYGGQDHRCNGGRQGRAKGSSINQVISLEMLVIWGWMGQAVFTISLYTEVSYSLLVTAYLTTTMNGLAMTTQCLTHYRNWTNMSEMPFYHTNYNLWAIPKTEQQKVENEKVSLEWLWWCNK